MPHGAADALVIGQGAYQAVDTRVGGAFSVRSLLCLLQKQLVGIRAGSGPLSRAPTFGAGGGRHRGGQLL